jgi:hypothetical protein
MPLATLTYCGEGLIAAWRHRCDPTLQDQIVQETGPCVEWLLRNQNPDGSWGAKQSGDQQRSAGVVTLLAWHFRAGKNDERIAQAVAKYCRFLLVRKLPGVEQPVRTTGFTALAVADLIQPGVTF